MSWFKKKIKVVVHDGDFHPDDVFACATLSLWAEKSGYSLDIVRTRDTTLIEEADIVADVGFVYDPENGRFDHHQKGGAGVRDNAIPYASFGLVWLKYGGYICGSTEVANRVESKLVVPVDAMDSGVSISKPNNPNVIEHATSNAIFNMNMTWQEDLGEADEQFKDALGFAKEILNREIVWARAKIDGEKETLKMILNQNEPSVLILDKKIEWKEAVSKNKKIKLVLYPRKNGEEWCIQVGRDDLENYNSDRINMPRNWWGLRGDKIAQESGVDSAIFCINGGWFALAKTKEGAIEMAQKALQNSAN